MQDSPYHSHHRHPVRRWLHRYGWVIAVIVGGVLLGALVARM
jgi:hypothetical protein